jgi:nitroreductase
MLKEIANWKSVRKFAATPVTHEQLLSVLEAGRRAPSWKNIQPWKFIAITQDTDKLKLSEAFGMGTLIKKAPAVILCVGLLDTWEKHNQRGQLKELMAHAGITMADDEIDKTFLDTALAKALSAKPASLMARTFESLGIAYGFMIAEAMNQGLGACIVGELANELVAVNNQKYTEVKQYFGLTEAHVITAAIILGIPAKETAVTPRKAASEIYSFFAK